MKPDKYPSILSVYIKYPAGSSSNYFSIFKHWFHLIGGQIGRFYNLKKASSMELNAVSLKDKWGLY